MKAIKITQEVLNYNSTRVNSSLGDIKVFSTLPLTWFTGQGTINNFRKASEDTLLSLGFKDIVRPPLLEGETYGDLVENIETNTFDYSVVPPVVLTPEEISQKQLEEETDRYLKRAIDGVNIYAKLSAEFRLAKLSGVLTEEGQKIIEATLIPVRNEVLAGQWISAKQILEELGNSVIGVDLYDRLWNLLTDYITENY